jgi:hypothetical protein
MQTQVIDTGYVPRQWQRRFHTLAHNKRFGVIVVHRRGGKTVSVINEILDRLLHCTLKNPQGAYVAPTYGQAKKIAWVYLKDYAQSLPGYIANEAELKVRFQAPHGNGFCTIHLLGADNADSLRGMYFDVIALDEYQDLGPDVFSLVVRPALADRQGSCFFIGTPKGVNDFKEKYEFALKNPNWFTFMLKASDSKLIPQHELDEIRAEIGDEAYMQEFECSFAGANTGAYFAKYINDLRDKKKIRSVPYDPALLVDTFWDLGMSDTTTIWFRQQHQMEYRYIDYYEMSGQGIDHYVKVLKDKGYVYGRHVLPHDVKVRDLSTGRSRLEAFQSLGIRVEVQSKFSPEDRISASRLILPLSYFDEAKCRKGLEALEAYSRKWDAKNKIWQDTPLHNWASHAADSFGYSAMDSRDTNKYRNQELPTRAEDSYNELEY